MSPVKTSSENQFSHVLVTYLNTDLLSHLKRKLGCVLATYLCTYCQIHISERKLCHKSYTYCLGPIYCEYHVEVYPDRPQQKQKTECLFCG